MKVTWIRENISLVGKHGCLHVWHEELESTQMVWGYNHQTIGDGQPAKLMQQHLLMTDDQVWRIAWNVNVLS